LFHNTAEREFPFPGKAVNLIRLGLRYVPRVLTHDSPAFPVYVQHDAVCVIFGFMEDHHQDLYHKVHGGKLIVEEYDPVFIGLLEGCFLPRFVFVYGTQGHDL
jgi:hypothetical protein